MDGNKDKINFDKINNVLQDIHLYKDTMEMVIKTLIWTASWIGGVLVHRKGEHMRLFAALPLHINRALSITFIKKIFLHKKERDLKQTPL